MNSLILRVTSRAIMPILLVFSVYLLIRGHNLPGGGFAGGLMGASAFVLYAFATNATEALKLMRFNPLTYIGWGIIITFISGAISLVMGEPMLTGLWIPKEVFYTPLLPSLGTPLIFDIGVYLIVIGISSLIIFTMIENH